MLVYQRVYLFFPCLPGTKIPNALMFSGDGNVCFRAGVHWKSANPSKIHAFPETKNRYPPVIKNNFPFSLMIFPASNLKI
jgi:hypothetical protein